MRTLAWMARSLSGTAAALLVTGCGGGGSSPGTTPAPTATMQLSTTTIAASAVISQPAPTLGFTVQFLTTSTSQFYVKGSWSTSGIASITAADTTGDFTIQFKSPSSLGIGTYQDTVTVQGCYDSACSQQVENSPQTIAVTYMVTTGPGTITSLSPNTVQADIAFTLTVNGSGFDASAVVIFNGNAVSTDFVSATQLTANISASAITQPGPYTVVVAPSLAGASSALSNQLILSVAALPSITGLTPSFVVAGSAGFTLTVMGSNFPQGAVVFFGDTALPTTWVDNNQLTAIVASAQVLNAGAIPITIATSSAADALVSAPVSFTVQPLPALSSNSIDPSVATAGSPAFALTVLGQGFVPSAVVQWNGTALQTTYVSELELQAQIPASDIASVGTAAITVQNSRGGPSASLPLKVAAAAPDAISLQITPDHAGAVIFNSLSFPTARSWSVNVGGTPSYAIIVDGKVVVAAAVNNNTQLIALDQATGATVWGPVDITGLASTTYDGGKVFVLSASIGSLGTVQSYDIESGVLDWSVTLNASTYGAGLTALNGLIYTSGPNQTFFALSEGTGSIVWTASVLNGGFGAPAATSTGVYASYACSTYDFQPLTGTEIFFTNTGCEGGGGATPVVANGLVYSPAGNSNSGGEVLNASTGALLNPYSSTGEPAFSATAGYFLQGGTLNALTSSNNTVLWSFTGDGGLITSPIVVSQAVIIESSSGNVYALDATTGQQLWTVNAGAAPQTNASNNVLAAGDGLLVVPAGNQIVAYTLSSNP
jgi:outer membrane protein assembly factor BamB